MAKTANSISVGHWLRQHPQLARIDLELSLCYTLECSRAHLLSHADSILSLGQLKQLQDWTDQLHAGTPFAYLYGKQEFWGLELAVDASVLVPRPDTETLVEQTLACLPDQTYVAANGMRPRLLDLGTGSGAIALALAAERKDIEIHACDISVPSLALAQTNSTTLGLPVHFHHSNWFTNINGSFDVIVANPPYIDPADPHLTALHAEPSHALVAQERGLADLRKICCQAAEYLHSSGWLLLEHGHDQGPAVRSLLAENGFSLAQSCKDLGGNERVSWGQKGADGAELIHG